MSVLYNSEHSDAGWLFVKGFLVLSFQRISRFPISPSLCLSASKYFYFGSFSLKKLILAIRRIWFLSTGFLNQRRDVYFLRIYPGLYNTYLAFYRFFGSRPDLHVTVVWLSSCWWCLVVDILCIVFYNSTFLSSRTSRLWVAHSCCPLEGSKAACQENFSPVSVCGTIFIRRLGIHDLNQMPF